MEEESVVKWWKPLFQGTYKKRQGISHDFSNGGPCLDGVGVVGDLRCG